MPPAAKDTLAQALLAAQSEMPAVEMRGRNPHFKSKYVKGSDLNSTAIPVLNRNGIVVLQQATHLDGAPALKTTLLHAATGDMIQETTPLVLGKDDPQGYGAALTYFKRYALAALLGISEQEDDDGNSAQPSPGHSVKVKDAAPAPLPTSPVGAATSNGAAAIEERLLDICDELGVDRGKTRDLIAKHPDDVEWLRRQLVTAEANLASMKESDASPFKTPVKK